MFQEIHQDLRLLIQRWVSLAANGGLKKLLRMHNSDIRAVVDRGGTQAETLKAYLEAYKEDEGVEEWTKEHMNFARAEVVGAWNRMREQRKRPASDGKFLQRTR